MGVLVWPTRRSAPLPTTPAPERSERFQLLDEISFLRLGEIDPEECVVVIDHVEQRRETAIVIEAAPLDVVNSVRPRSAASGLRGNRELRCVVQPRIEERAQAVHFEIGHERVRVRDTAPAGPRVKG
jgi:hypothetical protein